MFNFFTGNDQFSEIMSKCPSSTPIDNQCFEDCVTTILDRFVQHHNYCVIGVPVGITRKKTPENEYIINCD